MISYAAGEKNPDALDFLGLRDQFNEEERAVQSTVRRFVRERILPDIGTWFDQGRFPLELAREIGELGLLGMHLEGYGCAGTSAVSYGIACMELEAADSGVRSFVSVQGRSPCSRSGPTARRSRSSAGCRRWRRVRPSGASG